MSQRTFYNLCLFLLIGAYVWLFYVLFLDRQGNFSPCLFKFIFHIPCPACGTTSSIVLILKGSFLKAFYTNPNGYIVLPSMIFMTLVYVKDIVTAKKQLYYCYQKIDALFHNKILFSFFILFEAFIWGINIYHII